MELQSQSISSNREVENSFHLIRAYGMHARHDLESADSTLNTRFKGPAIYANLSGVHKSIPQRTVEMSYAPTRKRHQLPPGSEEVYYTLVIVIATVQ